MVSAEDDMAIKPRRIQRAKLQWGRAWLARKTNATRRKRAVEDAGFNGAALG